MIKKQRTKKNVKDLKVSAKKSTKVKGGITFVYGH